MTPSEPFQNRLRRLAAFSPFAMAAISLLLAGTLWLGGSLDAPARAGALPPGMQGRALAAGVTAALTTTASVTPTLTSTAASTASPTVTPTVSETLAATPTATATEQATPTPPPFAFLPIIVKPYPTSTPTQTPIPSPTPTRTPLPTPLLVCDQLSYPLTIPDDDSGGVEARLSVSAEGVIADLNLYVDIAHPYVGDLEVRLSRPGSPAVNVIHRPGYPASAYGCGLDDIVAILDDQMPRSVESKCGGVRPATSAPPVLAVSGSFYPNQPLAAFNAAPMAGEYVLQVIDHFPNDTGSLNAWCVELAFAEDQPPTPTPPPPSLPDVAWIAGVDGEDQALPLDCESRSAVDWAAYFDIAVGELAFFNHLPESANPDLGFVGNVYGAWGQIPPNDYGVHAAPIASLLGQYGLPALAVRQLAWDDLRAEIAAGRPVIVWVIGAVAAGVPVFYHPPDERITVVARYEHTVIVVGYSQTTVTVLNGAPPYDTYPLDQFLDSWSALRNMAVVAAP